jgi:hypothetical protein
MGCRERAVADVHCVLFRSRDLGAIVRRLGGRVESSGRESRLSGERVRLISRTTIRLQHKLVAVCDPRVGSWSSWHATAPARPMNNCPTTRNQDDVCQLCTSSDASGRGLIRVLVSHLQRPQRKAAVWVTVRLRRAQCMAGKRGYATWHRKHGLHIIPILLAWECAGH